MTVLEVKNATKRFGSLVAVQDVSLSVPKGELRAIIGPNGAGKTTFFNLISGFLAPSAGTIEFDGRDITLMPAHERVALGMARTFQITEIFPELTVFENVRVGTEVTAGYCLRPWISRAQQNDIHSRVEEVLLRPADPRTQAVAGRDLGADAHVLEYRQFGEYLGDLEGARHSERHALVRRHQGDIAPVEFDGAGARRQKAADQIEERRFAGAVRPDDRAQLAFGDAERHVLHRHETAEAFGRIPDFEHVHAASQAARLRRMKPSRPRGKNSTTSTNSIPTNDIQLMVMLER